MARCEASQSGSAILQGLTLALTLAPKNLDSQSPHHMNSGKSEDVTISQRGMELAIERSWFVKGQTIRDTVFVVVWNSFLGFILFEAPSLFLPIDGSLSLVAAIPGFVLCGAGIFLSYRVATQWLNRTVLSVSRSTISVRHGSLPWPGNKVLPVAGIKRLHADLSRLSRGPRWNRRYTYNLVAETADGQRTKLAGGFTRADAENVKQAIEKYLSIRPATPSPPGAAELDRQAIDNFHSGRPIEQTQADAAARNKPGAETTPLRGVIGVWTFVLVWNAYFWWVIWLIVSGGPTPVEWHKVALVSPFVLVGLGLIYLLTPWTVKFFRKRAGQKQAADQNKAG